METAKDLNIIAFDKTGTLTKGEIGVVGMATADGVDVDEALALTAAVEGDSEHPIAKSIRDAAEEKQLELPQINGFQILKGRGVQAEHDGAAGVCGRAAAAGVFGSSNGHHSLAQFAQESGHKGQSVVYLVRG